MRSLFIVHTYTLHYITLRYVTLHYIGNIHNFTYKLQNMTLHNVALQNNT